MSFLKDNHEMDELFSFEENKNNLITKAKRKSTMRMAFVSGLVSVLVLTLVVLIKLQVTPWLLDKETIAQENYYDVYGANIYIGPWEESIKLIGSQATATQYKLLNGRPVYRGEVLSDTHHNETHFHPNDYETYNYLGEKVMNFIHPGIESNELPKELNDLDVIQDHQIVEMGISFDRAYSLSEAKEMLPEGLQLQWAWIDTWSAEEVDAMQETDRPTSVFTEDEMIGFSMVDKVGLALNNPLENFMEAVNYGRNHKGPYQEDMKAIHDRLTKHGEVKESSVKVIGAVVVGNKEALQKIQKELYVRASSIGAVIDSLN